jgi:transcriptional regulator with XRE-family HTH domain
VAGKSSRDAEVSGGSSKHARKSAGLTQAEVAGRLQKPQSFVAKYENGERRLDVLEFVAVCRAIEADAVEIVGERLGAPARQAEGDPPLPLKERDADPFAR